MRPIKLDELNIRSIGDTIQMIGAVYAGEGRIIVTVFPDEVLEAAPTEVLCMDAGEWERFLLQTDVLEVEALSQTPDGRTVKAIVRKSQRQIDTAVAWSVYRRDEYRCRYCGNDNVPLTVDHLVRWEEFGPSIAANLLASCKRCNRTRGNKSYEEWLRDPYYVRVSQKLDYATRCANEEVAKTLSAIPRVTKVRSR
jgi:5-methylcytosine-specific restriction endonuclease McrA